MLYVNCDYTRRAPPGLEKMLEPTCGTDRGLRRGPLLRVPPGSSSAGECQRQDVDVQFLWGAPRQTSPSIRAALRPYQGVLSPATGHINGHETGAVEAHRPQVLALPTGPEGSSPPPRWRRLCGPTGRTRPGSTWVAAQNGIYQPPHGKRRAVHLGRAGSPKRDLQGAGAVPLLDGARLGYGLTARGSDVSLGTWPGCATCSTLGAPSAARCWGRRWSSPTQTCSGISGTPSSRTAAMLAKGRLLGAAIPGAV